MEESAVRRLRALVEWGDEFVVEVGRDGRIRYASPNFSRIARRDADALIGRPVDELVHPDDRDTLVRALGARDPTDLAVRWRHGGGAWRQMEGAVVPPDGPPEADVVSMLVLRDVTAVAARRTEHARAEAYLHAVLDSARQAFFMLAPDYTVLACNTAARSLATEYYGKTASPGDSFDAYIPDIAREPFKKLFQRALDGERVTAEARIPRPDGSPAWFRHTITPIADPDGGTVGVCYSADEITDAKLARDALHEGEQRYHALTEHAYDLIAEFDGDGRILYASPSHRDRLGIEPESILGTVGAKLIHPLDRPRVLESIARLQDEDHIILPPLRYADYGAGERIFETSLRTYGTATGERRILAISRDITERTELEEQLRQAQRLDAVGQLAGGIAHDFNNLLTIISGHAEQLIDRIAPDDPLRESAGEIQSASGRAASLTRQILAFSQSQMMTPRVVDVNALIADLGKMLHRLIGEDIRLVESLAPGVGRIRADPGQVEQLVVNLVVNARDAMPDGGDLTIATSVVESSGDEPANDGAPSGVVRIRVSDTGIGMDDAMRARIFDPFFTTKPPGSGTGLGLATVYGIVHQSGGRIRVQSAPGRGSDFEVDFPRHDSAETTRIDANGGRDDGRAGADAIGGHETVLLVEDDQAVRSLLARGLEDHGYRVLTAGSGDDAHALEQAENGSVDVLVTDLVMPGMGGSELASRLTAARPRLRVVVMSGYGDSRDDGRLQVPPNAAMLRKPFSPADLARVVRAALDG